MDPPSESEVSEMAESEYWLVMGSEGGVNGGEGGRH